MYCTIKNKEKCTELLKSYTGNNWYLKMLRRKLIENSEQDALDEFSIEYILKNIDFKPIQIGKVLKIADWYSEKKVTNGKWDVSFTPSKIEIETLLGETDTMYHCYFKYKQNMEPVMGFLPKDAVIGALVVPDYNEIKVDFDRYDRLSQLRDQNRVLKEHQKEAVRFLLSRKKCILADEMGLGKTASLSVAAIEGNFDSVVIICPASLKTNWKDELVWYVPERDITIIEGHLDKTKPELEEFLGYGIGKSGKKVAELRDEARVTGKWSDNRFIIVNFDILDEFYKLPRTRSKENIEKAFNESPLLKYIFNRKSLIIVDEAHRLSNRTSNRYKIILDLIKRGNPDSVYLSTGTPITNNPENFFNLLQIIGDPVTNNWVYYAKRYCSAEMILKKGEWRRCLDLFLQKRGKSSYRDLTEDEKEELKEFTDKNARKIMLTNGASNLEELKDRTSHLYLRRVKEDLLDLPEKRIHELIYEFTLQQELEYDRLWDEYEQMKLDLDPDAELNKELLEGAVYRKYCSNQMVPNTIRLAEEILSRGEKVLIATCYDEELYTLKEHFGDRCVVYNGKMSLKDKDNAREKFTNDPGKLVFIGNIIAAGVGLNLVSSHNIIFNNLSFVPSDNKQFEDRCWRMGQTQTVDIYYQMFAGTQYERIWDTVLRKTMVINEVIKEEKDKNNG